MIRIKRMTGRLPGRIRKTGVVAASALLLAATVLSGCAAEVAPQPSPAQPVSRTTWWQPETDLDWQVQLSGKFTPVQGVEVYDLDGVDTKDWELRRARRAGAKLVCYFNAGAWEDWRGDAMEFKRSVIGEPLDGWPGERWLDIRQQQQLLPLMAARMDECKRRGFDAVDPDNVDGYANDTGFDLSRRDQASYIRALARMAHERHLAFGLKNTTELVDELEPDIDFAVNEQCHEYDECDAYDRLLESGKPVVVLEYTGKSSRLCRERPEGMELLFKDLDLGVHRATC